MLVLTCCVFQILAHYPGWVSGEEDRTLQLNAVKNDLQLLLEVLGCQYRIVLRSAKEKKAPCPLIRSL